MTDNTISRVGTLPEPGRINNLTPDEEQKLKDMWAHILMYLGYISQDLTAVPSSLTSHEEHKKKKSGWFGRKTDPKKGKQEAELQSFQSAVKNMTADEVQNAIFTMTKVEHPDNILLRFLRARKWDVNSAVFAFGEMLQWRKDSDIESVFNRDEEAAGQYHIKQLSSKKCYLYGTDKKGHPLAVVSPRYHFGKDQPEEEIKNFVMFIIESERLRFDDKSGTISIIFDLTDFGVANMDYTALKFLIQTLESYYPETLAQIYVHNAPWIFPPMWNIIKNWLDPVVASKVKFTKKPSDLTVNIPSEYVPKSLGGTCEHEYHYFAGSPNENKLMEDTETRDTLLKERNEVGKKFINATVDWVKATAKDQNQIFQEKKNELAGQLKTLYWKVDPYIRARSIFDRDGSTAPFVK